MGKLMSKRLIQYYDENIMGRVFYDRLQHCTDCRLHFSCNVLDPNGHGITCPKCNKWDHLLDVGTVEIRLVETDNPSNVGHDWNNKDELAYDDGEIEPEYNYFGIQSQKVDKSGCHPWDETE